MGEIVNLNKVRKARDKAATQAKAKANRASHGRAKAQTLADQLEAERQRRQLDQSRLDDD